MRGTLQGPAKCDLSQNPENSSCLSRNPGSWSPVFVKNEAYHGFPVYNLGSCGEPVLLYLLRNFSEPTVKNYKFKILRLIAKMR